MGMSLSLATKAVLVNVDIVNSARSFNQPAKSWDPRQWEIRGEDRWTKARHLDFECGVSLYETFTMHIHRSVDAEGMMIGWIPSKLVISILFSLSPHSGATENACYTERAAFAENRACL